MDLTRAAAPRKKNPDIKQADIDGSERGFGTARSHLLLTNKMVELLQWSAAIS
jgi:hypothetical protein